MMEKIGRWLAGEDFMRKQPLETRAARVEMVKAQVDVLESRVDQLEGVVEEHGQKLERRESH